MMHSMVLASCADREGVCSVSNPPHSHPRAFFKQFWEKPPGQNWAKMIDLTSKLEEINDIEHNKDSKTFPQNQTILDCII